VIEFILGLSGVFKTCLFAKKPVSFRVVEGYN
jgi:hypothetical protein